MSYKIVYTEDAKEDLRRLDNSQVRQVRKMISKVAENPLPKSEGGYGTPLGNRGGNNLTGLCKIKLLKLGIRVVYRINRENEMMKIIVIAVRADEEVYDIAFNRKDD